MITTSSVPATKSHRLNEIFVAGKRKNLWSDTIRFLGKATPWVGVELITIEDAKALSDEQIEQLRQQTEAEEAREAAEVPAF